MIRGLEPMRYQVFYKSGDSVILDEVMEYSLRNKDGRPQEHIFGRKKSDNADDLDIFTIDADLVEAVVRLPIEEPFALPTREA